MTYHREVRGQPITSLVKLVLPGDSIPTYFSLDEKAYRVRRLATLWVVESTDAPEEPVALVEHTAVGWRASSPDRGYQVDDDILFLAIANVLGMSSSS